MGKVKELYSTLMDDYQLSDHDAEQCLKRYIDLKEKYPTIQALLLHMYSKEDPYSITSLTSLQNCLRDSITKSGHSLSVLGIEKVLETTTIPNLTIDQILYESITEDILLPLIGLTYYKPEETISLTKETYLESLSTIIAQYISCRHVLAHIHQSLFNIYLNTNISYYP